MHVLHFFSFRIKHKMFDSKRKKCKTYFQKYIRKSLAQKSTIKTNQRRELRNQRIRKPELDAIVISSMAKNDFLRAFFSLLMLCVGCDFADTPYFCCFFSVCALEKKEQTFGVLFKSHPTISKRKERNACRRSRFLQRLSSQKRPVLFCLIL